MLSRAAVSAVRLQSRQFSASAAAMSGLKERLSELIPPFRVCEHACLATVLNQPHAEYGLHLNATAHLWQLLSCFLMLRFLILAGRGESVSRRAQ
jgi:hypothetical protein